MAREESVLHLTPEQKEAAMSLFSECSDLREFGCRVLERATSAMTGAEAQRECGAARGERSEARENSRNGYRPRSLKTASGGLSLRVPKLRRGTYSPEGLLGRYTRVEASMVGLVQETCVAGVSTRKVERVASELGVSSLSSPGVSSLCSGLDAEVEAFRTRDLGGGARRCVRPGATYMKCRVEGRYVSAGLVTAIGLAEDGRKGFLGCDLVDTESYESWAAFLSGLRARGLRGVRLVVFRRPRGPGARGLGGLLRLRLAEVRHAPAAQPAGPRAHPGGQEGRGRPGQGRHDAARPAGRPGRVGGGLPLGRPGLGGGRQDLRLGARGRAGLHVLPRGALGQDQDQQRAPIMRTGP